MSVEDRLDAMERLWKSFATSTEKIASPEWHGEILKSRLEKVNSGNAKFLTLSELRERFPLPKHGL